MQSRGDVWQWVGVDEKYRGGQRVGILGNTCHVITFHAVNQSKRKTQLCQLPNKICCALAKSPIGPEPQAVM